MTDSEASLELRRRRLALFALFALPGLTIASWVTRTPQIRDRVHASTAEMGLILFGVSIGAVSGVVVSGVLVGRLGTRAVIVAGSASTVASMPVVAAGAELHLAVVVAVGLGLFGLGLGMADVALNLDATIVEQASDLIVLPPMHGFYSVGACLGALAGVGCTLAEVPVGLHLGLVGALGAATLATTVRHLAPGSGLRAPTTEEPSRAPGQRLWSDKQLLMIGIIVLAFGLGEGTAVDWLPLVMVDGHGTSAATGSTVFVVFTACMSVGRFTGGYVLSRVGPIRAVRWTGLAAVAGIGLVSLMDSLPVVAVAVVLWGLGISLGFPIAISAAGTSGPDSAARVSFVAILGYIAFLAGPPMLGFLGEHFGLRGALLAPLFIILVAVLCASAVGQRGGTHRSAVPAGAQR